MYHSNDHTGLAIAGIVLLIILAVAAGFFLSAFLIMLAWGGIAGIFGWITISYAQALSVALGMWLIGGMLHGGNYVKTNNNKD